MLLTADSPYTFTQGDATLLSFTATDDRGNPVDISLATFSTQIQGPNGVGPVTFPDGQHTIVNATEGQFTLALGTADTAACGEGEHKEIVTEIVIGGSPQYFRGRNMLTVYPAEPMQ
jgi:hypothetical protein